MYALLVRANGLNATSTALQNKKQQSKFTLYILLFRVGGILNNASITP